MPMPENLDRNALVWHLRERGLTLLDIGREVGISAKRVGQLLQREAGRRKGLLPPAGYYLRRGKDEQHQWSDQEKQTLRRLRYAGYTYEEISGVMGFTVRQVTTQGDLLGLPALSELVEERTRRGRPAVRGPCAADFMRAARTEEPGRGWAAFLSLGDDDPGFDSDEEE